MTTIAERLVAGLEMKGFRPGKQTVNYQVFTGEFLGRPIWFFVGKNGALRYSRTGKVSQTGVCADNVRDKFLSEKKG